MEITQRTELGPGIPIVTHGPGGFMGELAQLSGRPSLVDAHALEPVEALVIPPERLRALLVAEAELGERIMRALILRRVGLLDGSAGLVIIGRAAMARCCVSRDFWHATATHVCDWIPRPTRKPRH